MLTLLGRTAPVDRSSGGACVIRLSSERSQALATGCVGVATKAAELSPRSHRGRRTLVRNPLVRGATRCERCAGLIRIVLPISEDPWLPRPRCTCSSSRPHGLPQSRLRLRYVGRRRRITTRRATHNRRRAQSAWTATPSLRSLTREALRLSIPSRRAGAGTSSLMSPRPGLAAAHR